MWQEKSRDLYVSQNSSEIAHKRTTAVATGVEHPLQRRKHVRHGLVFRAPRQRMIRNAKSFVVQYLVSASVSTSTGATPALWTSTLLDLDLPPALLPAVRARSLNPTRHRCFRYYVSPRLPATSMSGCGGYLLFLSPPSCHVIT